ncbi:MAG: hypothetical protein SH819_11270 [Cytophagales bacterium]|nr:hypothetical protein [Cytophagales bacterium]
MKNYILTILAVISANTAFGQAAELSGFIGTLQESFSHVQTSTKTFEQDIKLLEFSTVLYAYNEVDQKGGKVSYTNEFNLSDIDPYAVRQVTQKDIILVVLAVKNKQKLVKVSKNSETQPYDDQLNIHAKNVDHARDIMELIKKCIPLAEKITNGKLKLSAYEDMVSWLSANVKNVTTGTKSINQGLAKGEYPGSFKFVQVESDGKTSHQEEFTFNLADINLNSLLFKVSGNRFALNMEMSQRLKVISVVRDGQSRPFVDDLTIYTNNVDEARDIKNVLTLAAPLAIAKIKTELPALKTVNEALQAMAALTKDVRIGDKTEGQVILPKCVTTYTLVEQTPTTTVKNVYDFNWVDVNPNTFRIQVSGDKMVMELPTLDKKKVVMSSKNDKLEGFTNEINIFVQDVEVGRRMKEAVDKVISYCKSSYKDPFPAKASGIVEWLKGVVGEVTVEQVSQKGIMESPEPDNLNKIKLTVRDIKASSSVEEIFEFNFSDINPNSVDFEIRGKWVFVKMETNFKSKIIKAYKDGKIQPYASSVSIAMSDIEASRGVIAAIKKCIEEFKSK